MKIFARIRFYWGAAVISVVVAAIMIPLIYLFPRHKGTIMHRLNRVLLFLLGARIETVGSRDPAANMFLFNHQGIIDIITMEAVENIHLGWVAKKELFDLPWFGHLLKKGEMISVDRQNKAGLLKLVKDVDTLVNQKNRPFAIFPEGTRAKGQNLLPFKAGAKFIANKLKLRIQPVVITGSKHLFNEHDRTAHSSTVKVIYLEAFDAADAPKEWYDDVRAQMQKVIDQEYEQYGRSR